MGLGKAPAVSQQRKYVDKAVSPEACIGEIYGPFQHKSVFLEEIQQSLVINLSVRNRETTDKRGF